MGAAKKIQQHQQSAGSVLLKNSILFAGVDEQVISILDQMVDVFGFKEGDPVFIQNEICDRVYFVSSGSVELLRFQDSSPHPTRIKVLGQGEFITEMSVLTKPAHSTSCFALEDTIITSLHGEKFLSTLQNHPEIATSLVRMLAKLNQQLQTATKNIHPAQGEDFKFSSEMMKIIPAGWMQKFEMLPVSFSRNTLTIAMRNPMQEDFYVALRNNHPNLEVVVKSIKEEDYEKHKKELAHHYSGLARPPAAEKSAKPLSPKLSVESVKFALASNDLFVGVHQESFDKLIPHIGVETFSDGDVILNPSDNCDAFYIIQEGEVEFFRPLGNNLSTSIVTLGKYSSFAEISCILETPHTIRSVAKGATRLLVLKKNVFDALTKNTNVNIAIADTLAVRLNAVNREARTEFFAGEIEINQELLKLVPFSLLNTHCILPLSLEGDELTLGVVDADSDIIYHILNRYLSKYSVKLTIVNEKILRDAINKSAGTNKAVGDDLSNVVELHPKTDPVAFLNKVIEEAYLHRASDIHIEPQSSNYVIRYRIDGELAEVQCRTSLDFGKQVTNRIKILSKMDISEQRLPQDGQLNLTLGDIKYEARSSTVPTNYGEKAVLRLVNKDNALIPLKGIAPDKHVIKYLRDMTRHRQGLFIVTGPTGSGKTTTIYSLLNEVVNVKSNIVTIENPIELAIPGITQIEINEAAGLHFNDILPSILRQDPDIIMVGEIRSEESAKIVFEAAMTGHLVITTLHTSNSFDVINRLKELGVNEASISSTLLGVIAQRLLPALCPACKDYREANEHEKRILTQEFGEQGVPQKVAYGRGCEKCRETGYHGRIPAFEFWSNTLEVKNAIANNSAPSQLYSILLESGFQTLNNFGLKMVLNGLTTVAQVESFLFGLNLNREFE